MPALRISSIVHGRCFTGTRVSYLVDPHGAGIARAGPETLILKRWRKRKREGYTFSGGRLGPNTWRGVDLVFASDAGAACALDVNGIEARLGPMRDRLRSHHYSLPAAATLHALFAILGPHRLRKLVERHLDPSRAERYGTPDLFLFAVDQESGDYHSAHFVEVKKPREHVSKDQREEMAFMVSLGLNARVLRLIER